MDDEDLAGTDGSEATAWVHDPMSMDCATIDSYQGQGKGPSALFQHCVRVVRSQVCHYSRSALRSLHQNETRSNRGRQSEYSY